MFSLEMQPLCQDDSEMIRLWRKTLRRNTLKRKDLRIAFRFYDQKPRVRVSANRRADAATSPWRSE
jgi:hypothetical protein